MSKKMMERTEATTAQCFDWLKRVAELAVTQETDMTNAIGLDQIGDVLRL